MKMKILSFTIAIAACAGASAQTKVRFVAQESPPFNFLTDKKPDGASYHISKKVCSKLKWDCSFEIVPQKRGLTMIETGEADIIMGLIAIPERENILIHSSPTWTSTLAFIGLKSTSAVKKAEELMDFTVAGVRASAALKKATELKDKIGGIKIIEANNYPEAFKALSEKTYGDKGAVSSYADVGTYLAKELKTEVHPIHVLEEVKFVSGISKKTPEKVLKDFNKAVEDMRASGELKTTLAQWGMQQ